jgi:hypothetical protein
VQRRGKRGRRSALDRGRFSALLDGAVRHPSVRTFRFLVLHPEPAQRRDMQTLSSFVGHHQNPEVVDLVATAVRIRSDVVLGESHLEVHLLSVARRMDPVVGAHARTVAKAATGRMGRPWWTLYATIRGPAENASSINPGTPCLVVAAAVLRDTADEVRAGDRLADRARLVHGHGVVG